MKYPTLKEAFLKEDIGESRFLRSIKKQLQLTGLDPDRLAEISALYDTMLKMLSAPEDKANGWFEKQDAFAKFHYRIAKKEFDSGVFSPDEAPSGMELGTVAYNDALNKKRAADEKAAREEEAEAKRRALLTPAEREREDAAKHHADIYGGNPYTARPGHRSGLGS